MASPISLSVTFCLGVFICLCVSGCLPVCVYVCISVCLCVARSQYEERELRVQEERAQKRMEFDNQKMRLTNQLEFERSRDTMSELKQASVFLLSVCRYNLPDLILPLQLPPPPQLLLTNTTTYTSIRSIEVL